MWSLSRIHQYFRAIQSIIYRVLIFSDGLDFAIGLTFHQIFFVNCHESLCTKKDSYNKTRVSKFD